MKNYILLLDGPDDQGIIFKTTKILTEYQCNIISQDEYVSPDGEFFMRTLFQSDKETNLDTIKDSLSRSFNKPFNIRIFNKSKKNIVILVTKEHHCLAEILIQHYFKKLDANILAIIGNHEVLKPFVDKFNIPYHFISHEGKSRELHEEEVKQVIQSYNPDYIVLAKYMRILSPKFINAFTNKIINIHHSFLPAFIGANPYKQAFERGVKIIGATAHFVTEDLDEGPIIAQDVKEVNHTYNALDMAKEGKEIEKSVLALALKLVFNDKVFIYNNRTIIL